MLFCPTAAAAAAMDNSIFSSLEVAVTAFGCAILAINTVPPCWLFDRFLDLTQLGKTALLDDIARAMSLSDGAVAAVRRR